MICEWSDKKNYLIHYRMLKFYLRHGMVGDEIQTVISFKQSKWLEKYIGFLILKKEIKLKVILRKTSINYYKTHPMEKIWRMFVIELKPQLNFFPGNYRLKGIG